MTDSLIRKLTRLFCCLAHSDKHAHSVRLPIQLHFATHHYHLRWLASNMVLHYQRECSCNDTGEETAKCWPTVQDTLHQVYFHLAFGNMEVTDSLISYSVLQASFVSHKMQHFVSLCDCTQILDSVHVSLISKQHKLFISSNLNTYSDLGALLASNEGHKELLWVQTPPVDRWDLCHQGWELGCF